MAQQTEEGFLKAIAERPNDRALRSIFCDWLLEQGNPRGEAMALFDQGALSGPDRRRLERLQERHRREWLGPLADAVVVDECRFAGGLLHAVRFPANLAVEHYAALTGEPRLATVEALSIEPGRAAADLGGFLGHPVLARVVSLEGDVPTLLKVQAFAFAPQVLRVMLWAPRDELSALAAFAPLKSATVLQLATVEYVTPELAEELADAVIGSGALADRHRLELVARFATIEGVVRWLELASARLRGPARGSLVRWAMDHAETQLGLEGDRFEDFTIDALARAAREEVPARIVTAATVLALLAKAEIQRVDVRHIPGGRLNKDELNTLRGALRRLPTLKEFRVAGVIQSP